MHFCCTIQYTATDVDGYRYTNASTHTQSSPTASLHALQVSVDAKHTTQPPHSVSHSERSDQPKARYATEILIIASQSPSDFNLLQRIYYVLQPIHSHKSPQHKISSCLRHTSIQLASPIAVTLRKTQIYSDCASVQTFSFCLPGIQQVHNIYIQIIYTKVSICILYSTHYNLSLSLRSGLLKSVPAVEFFTLADIIFHFAK